MVGQTGVPRAPDIRFLNPRSRISCHNCYERLNHAQSHYTSLAQPCTPTQTCPTVLMAATQASVTALMSLIEGSSTMSHHQQGPGAACVPHGPICVDTKPGISKRQPSTDDSATVRARGYDILAYDCMCSMVVAPRSGSEWPALGKSWRARSAGSCSIIRFFPRITAMPALPLRHGSTAIIAAIRACSVAARAPNRSFIT